MISPATAALAGRLVAIGVLVVILQVASISQVTIFGTNADVVPLVVAAVGLLCGSVPGALFGFCAGLFVDTVLVEDLGISSLVYLLAGYGAGRVRELRDPQAVLVPVLVGAGATVLATFGYSFLQFLLGVDAPVSFLLVRQLIATLVVNTLIALPVHALVRRALGTTLPDDPRRRRRRAYTTGGLSPLQRA